jgi:chromosome segregation ATPase
VINLDEDTVEVKTETEVAISEIDMVIADDFSNIQTTQTMRPARVAQRRDSGLEQQRRDRFIARNRTASVSLSRHQTPVAPTPSASLMGDHESNTGDIINRTMYELTSRNTVLEKALADAKLSLSAQLEATKKAEEQNTQLSSALEAQSKKLADVVGKQHQFQKFLTGMGNDYDILNRKNSEMKQQLKDALAEKEGIIKELEVMRGDLEKASAGAEVWGKYKDQVKEGRAENKRLLDRLRLLEGEFNQATGLLVEERNRTQELEIRIEEDRKLNMKIVETVTGVKEAIIGQLRELKGEMVDNMETGTGEKIENINQSWDTHMKTYQERMDAAMTKISERLVAFTSAKSRRYSS